MPELSLDRLNKLLEPNCLEVLGGFDCAGEPEFPDWAHCLVLLGPSEPGFWPHLKAQPEWGGPDPVDSWSRRVIGRLACDLGGKARFPFGGPPYHPFYGWALRTGRIWDSPVKLLVHDTQGLMVSIRGALILREVLEFPAASKPCETCVAPCLSACPVGALTGARYDVGACHQLLDLPEGADCLGAGCQVRRACPVSQGYARLAEQSAYHMGRFHRAG
ncbi:MAG: ferredoxin [Pseudotabrizicola sp.]|uniref:ferredoxin n=1 Tax=Pseudotabrizicola sp. TaxID=2939647 RepID=UPI00272F4D12|nr:ferredoxin [Pseudotabrizicola sp.]MDP2081752.1 ferredoxin [Pseudotabrizicola sp.]MDZ7573047.1 ferredoxin [Pseudotabrizicola sp.]